MRISKYILIIAAVLTGCKSAEKLAQKCADRFPVKAETVYIPGESRYDTTYIAGDTMVLQDTIRVECDSAKQVITKYVYRTVNCPDSKVITQYVTDTVRITQENTAKTAYLQLSIDALTEKNKGQGKALLWLSVGCFVLLVWTLRNPIISLVKKIFA